MQEPAEFLLPKSNISDGLLADIATAKFVDHLPLNRQEKIIARAGVDFSRSTLSGQLMLAAGILEEKLGPLLRRELLKSNLLHVDETSFKVLRFTDVQSVKQAYMWLFNSTGDRPLLWYEYRPGRSGDFLSDFLASYAGDILTDAYSPMNRSQHKRTSAIFSAMRMHGVIFSKQRRDGTNISKPKLRCGFTRRYTQSSDNSIPVMLKPEKYSMPARNFLKNFLLCFILGSSVSALPSCPEQKFTKQ